MDRARLARGRYRAHLVAVTMPPGGFEVRETLVLLRFTEPAYKDLVVECSAISVGDLREAAKLASINADNPSELDLAKIDRLIAAFAGSLRSWNLTRRGKPIPATLRGVQSLERYAEPPGIGALNLVEAWMVAMSEEGHPPPVTG